MLNIADEIKELYHTDYLPFREKNVSKELRIYFPSLNITIENDRIYTESMKLTESLCSEEDLVFGGCEAAQFEITIADVREEINGKEFIVTQILDGTYTMPLGTYVVDSVKKRNDLRFKDITAYDNMIRFDKDVTEWYNKITFPISLKQFRESLCKFIGVNYESQELPNDNYMITKTLDPKTLIGRDVLKSIGEINGMFGHFTRENKLKFIDLKGLGLFPAETLYPAVDLFPDEPGEFMYHGEYQSVFYEDYQVNSIDSLTIRNEEGSIGITVGNTIKNPYIIQGNFLVYGKSASELKKVAENILLRIKNKYYIPHVTNMIGLPYLEVGDSVAIMKGEDIIESFIFSRTLTGIQALRDEISATGNENRNNKVTLSTQIEQAEGKIRKIINNVDELSNEMIDTFNGLESKITQTAESIMTNVTDSLNGVESNIQQLANEISFKVSQGEMESAIQIAIDGIQIIASQIALEGVTTINGGFKIDLNGDMECVKATLTNCNFRNGINYVVPETGIPYTVLEFLGNNKFGWGIDATMSLFRGRVIFDEIPRCGDDLLLTSADLGKTVANYTHKHTTNLTVEAGYAPSEVVDGNLITFKNASGGNETGATPGYVKAYISSQSDERLKDMIGTIDEPLKEKYMKLVPMVYRFKDGVKKNDTRICFGFSAQEVAKIFCTEEYSLTDIDYEPLTGEKPYCPDGVYHLNDRHFHGLHTYMIQSQQKELSDLKAELSELKQQLQKKGVI